MTATISESNLKRARSLKPGNAEVQKATRKFLTSCEEFDRKALREKTVGTSDFVAHKDAIAEFATTVQGFCRRYDEAFNALLT